MFILSAVAKFAPSVLPFLGKLFKGKATNIGDVATAVGALVAGSPHVVGLWGVVTPDNAVALLHEVGFVISMLGQLVAAFGFGRKAQEAASGQS